MATDMFTPDEAFNFLTEQLKVENVRERMSRDRRNLLDEIVVAMQTEMPFQNIHLLRVSPEERRGPTLEETKSAIISKAGGLCVNLNVAVFYLLRAIGFDVVLVHGKCTSSTVGVHVGVYARDVDTPGDTFLVEAGMGLPTFRTIKLDFETESPVFRDSFLEYKYIWHGGKLLRMHGRGDPAPLSNLPDGVLFTLDGWRRFSFSDVFTDPKVSPLHSSLCVIGFPGRRAIMVINDKTLIENESGDLVVTHIPGGDEGIAAEMKRLFSTLSEEDIKQAVTNWRKSEKQSLMG